MKKELFLILTALAGLSACNKDENLTGPQAGPTVDKDIRQLTYVEELKSEKIVYEDTSTVSRRNFTRTFDYDNQRRVTRIATHYANSHEQDFTMDFDYATEGKILLQRQTSGSNVPYTYEAKLNEAGNITDFQPVNNGDNGTQQASIKYKFTYTVDNRLEQWEETIDHKKTDGGSYTYDNGMFAAYARTSAQYSNQDYAYRLDPGQAYRSRYPNQSHIDILAYLSDKDAYNGYGTEEYPTLLFQIGRLGKSGDYLPEVFPVRKDSLSPFSPLEIYTTPNQTIPIRYKYVRWMDSSQGSDISYTFDGDNCLTGITIRRPFEVFDAGYDIVVSDELISPAVPKAGYKCEIKNRKETKIDEGYDTFTYHIFY